MVEILLFRPQRLYLIFIIILSKIIDLTIHYYSKYILCTTIIALNTVIKSINTKSLYIFYNKIANK